MYSIKLEDLKRDPFKYELNFWNKFNTEPYSFEERENLKKSIIESLVVVLDPDLKASLYSMLAGLLLFTSDKKDQESEKKGLKSLKKAVLSQNPFAQHNLAKIYAEGNLIPKNVERAIVLYKSAGEQYENSLFELALLYYDTKNFIEARQTFNEVDRLYGNVEALYNLGIMCKQGLGGEKDDFSAFYFFTKAANKHHTLAMLELGFSYHLGLGVEKNYNEASNWYTMVIDQDNEQAYFYLGLLYNHTKIHDLAVSNYLKSFGKIENHLLLHNLGQIYYYADELKNNRHKATLLFEKAFALKPEKATAEFLMQWKTIQTEVPMIDSQNPLLIKVNDKNFIDKTFVLTPRQSLESQLYPLELEFILADAKGNFDNQEALRTKIEAFIVEHKENKVLLKCWKEILSEFAKGKESILFGKLSEEQKAFCQQLSDFITKFIGFNQKPEPSKKRNRTYFFSDLPSEAPTPKKALTKSTVAKKLDLDEIDSDSELDIKMKKSF